MSAGDEGGGKARRRGAGGPSAPAPEEETSRVSPPRPRSRPSKARLDASRSTEPSPVVANPGAVPAAAGVANRRRLTPKDRRRQILEAAISYFSEVGFDGGTRDLARRLGVTQPLIYRYFPSKEALIREVYDEVYLGRWRSEWESLLTDRSVPLRERLVTFYDRFTAIAFDPEWMRIYLFAGLRGVGINQWWISFVEQNVLARIAEELRRNSKLPSLAEAALTPSEIELMWLTHGGIFYAGIRRHVYGAEPSVALSETIELAVDQLLAGYPAASVASRLN